MQRSFKRTVAAVLASVFALSAFTAFDASAFTAKSTDYDVTKLSEQSVGIQSDESTLTAAAPNTNIEGTTAPQTSEPQTTSPQPTSEPSSVLNAVQNLRIDENYTDRLVVRWDRVNGADGYRVYFHDDTDKEAEYQYYVQGNNDYAVIYNLKPNSIYYVKVTAYVIKDGEKIEGEAALKTFSTIPVPAVTNLRVNDNYPDRLIVKWDRAPRVSGYKVYFRDDTAAEGSYKFVAQGNNDYAVIYKLKPNNKYHIKVVTFAEQNGVRYESEAAYSTLSTIPVPNVKNIRNTGSYTDRIVLKWDRVKGASGYKVYYCDGESSTLNYKFYVQGNNDYAVIYNLKAGNRYFFKVSAYVTYNGVKYEGNTAGKRTATQPAAVKGLKMTNTSKRCLQFSWNRNANASGYKIYRSSYKSNGKYVLYKTITDNRTTDFKDSSVEEGRGYYYCVKAYRNANNTTYHSAANYIRLVCGLTGPNFSLTSQLSRVNISWDKNPNAGGYEIFYSTSKNGKYHYYDYTKGTSFTTDKLPVGKTYYFRVRPYLIHGSGKYKIVGDYYTKSVKVTNTFNGKDPGDTFILISIDQQHMWYYLNGDLYRETDVVTGNADGNYNTPKGYYRIYQKARCTYLNGPGYSSYVDYWMAFNGAIGIHDASWRNSFGGNIYKGNGSHGCVNTPFSAVKDIYNHTSIGTRVIVY